MKSSKILALFDFCETITNFQTLEKFLPMIKNKNVNFNNELNLIRRNEYAKLNLSYPRYEYLINCPVKIVKDASKEFVYDFVLPNLNLNIMNKLFWHQDKGHEIAIVSGGLEIYIREFAKIYNIKNIIAVSLEIKNGLFTGDIDGIHTMQERKLYKLYNMINLCDYDLKNSYAYSDCASDIPLLSLVGNANVIECGKNLLWAKILNYKIIKKDN